MPPEFQSKPQGAQVPGTSGYEQRDASAKWIFGVVGFLLVSGIAIHFLLAGMLSSLNGTPTPSDAWRPLPHPNEASPQARTFPKLQVSPPRDLEEFRAREEEQLHTYGWINRTSGIVRIPIERAMELVLQKGLPARTAPGQDRAGPSSYELMQQRPAQKQAEIKEKQ